MKKRILEISVGVLVCIITVLLIKFGLNNISSNISETVPPPKKEAPKPPKKKTKIQVALLLDTSGSMDGLLEQAKSQLWLLVNELADAQQNGENATLEIALYEYGKDALSYSNGYVRMITPLTSDLDMISKELFALRTNGGDEYCGKVILDASSQLNWSQNSDDLKMIFIAGNEPFNQGQWNYLTSCQNANNLGITVNTIFCGDYSEGINTYWKHGADLTGGNYMNIDHNSATTYYDAPQDQDIAKLNEQLNQTYLYYGSKGRSKFQNMNEQDMNANSYSQSNGSTRAIFKSKSAYKNTEWDLVDATAEAQVELEEVAEETLPEVLQGLTVDEKQKVIDEKAKEREKIKSEIARLSTEREAYILEQKKLDNSSNELNDVMLDAIKTKAAEKSFEFK